MTKRKRKTLCPMCQGEGRVYRMTAAYEAMATSAPGTFGWTGSTHEWRTCRICSGKGLVR
jgi:DnaJ-class molecular chaperone